MYFNRRSGSSSFCARYKDDFWIRVSTPEHDFPALLFPTSSPGLPHLDFLSSLRDRISIIQFFIFAFTSLTIWDHSNGIIQFLPFFPSSQSHPTILLCIISFPSLPLPIHSAQAFSTRYSGFLTSPLLCCDILPTGFPAFRNI